MMSQSDPYVLVSVPGTNVQQERTKVVKSSAHPEWHQAYGYDVTHSREQRLTLLEFGLFQMRDVSGMEFLLQVFDKDTMSKDDPLGEVKWNNQTRSIKCFFIFCSDPDSSGLL